MDSQQPSSEEIALRYLEELPWPPYPFQEQAILTWFDSEDGILVCAPTGTGKTVIAETALENDREWEARVARERPSRVRLVSGAPGPTPRFVVGAVAVWAGPVTTAGRIEMLPFVHEQTVTITAHRFGIRDREIATLPI